MFALVSSRYERASTNVTSNKPFSHWGKIFGDDVVAAATIDRLVHHAEILSLKDKNLGSPPPAGAGKVERGGRGSGDADIASAPSARVRPDGWQRSKHPPASGAIRPWWSTFQPA